MTFLKYFKNFHKYLFIIFFYFGNRFIDFKRILEFTLNGSEIKWVKKLKQNFTFMEINP